MLPSSFLAPLFICLLSVQCRWWGSFHTLIFQIECVHTPIEDKYEEIYILTKMCKH